MCLTFPRDDIWVSSSCFFSTKLSEKALRYTSTDLAPCKNRMLPIRCIIHFLVFVFMIYDQIPNQTKCDLSQNVSLRHKAKGGKNQLILPSFLVLPQSAVLRWFAIAIQSQSCRHAISWLNIDCLMLCTKLIQFVVSCQLKVLWH